MYGCIGLPTALDLCWKKRFSDLCKKAIEILQTRKKVLNTHLLHLNGTNMYPNDIIRLDLLHEMIKDEMWSGWNGKNTTKDSFQCKRILFSLLIAIFFGGYGCTAVDLICRSWIDSSAMLKKCVWADSKCMAQAWHTHTAHTATNYKYL